MSAPDGAAAGPAEGRVDPVPGIYIASKAVHGPRWRELRDAGVPIISTWIDEAEAGRTTDWADLWDRCAREPARAAVTVLYAEDGEVLKGALAEVGAALSHGRWVVVVGPVDHTWTKHRRVVHAPDLRGAMARALLEVHEARAAALAGRAAEGGAGDGSLTDIIGKFTARAVAAAADPRPVAWRITLDDGSNSYVETEGDALAAGQHYGASVEPLYAVADVQARADARRAEAAPSKSDLAAQRREDDREYYRPDASGYSRADEEWFFDMDGKP